MLKMFTRRNSSALGRRQRSLPVGFVLAETCASAEPLGRRGGGQPVGDSGPGRKMRRCRQLGSEGFANNRDNRGNVDLRGNPWIILL